MAIRKKDDKKTSNIPSVLQPLLLRGFTEQFMAKKYEDSFKETKKEVTNFLKTTDEMDLEISSSFTCDQGRVTVAKGRESVDVDTDKLLELVKVGKVTIEQVFATISTWKKEDLEKTLSTPIYESIVTKSTSNPDGWSLTFVGSAEFKAKCEAEFSVPVAKITVKSEAAAPVTVKTVKAPSSIEKAKAAAKAAKAIKAAKSADEDLDSILGEKES